MAYARADQFVLSETQVHRFIDYTNHQEDVDFWHNVFSQRRTNIAEVEFAEHLSIDGVEELGRNLSYDQNVSSTLLNTLTALNISYMKHCEGFFDSLPVTNRTTNMSEFMDELRGWQVGWLHQVATRPELDRPLAEKLLPEVKPPNFWVGTTLARNTNTPVDILEILSGNQYNLGFDLAHNPNLPTNILWRILHDADEAVAGQFKAPESKRDWYVINTKSAIVRQARANLGSRNTTPPSVLSELATNEAREVRMAVGLNTNAPTEVALALRNDPDAQVAIAAARGLAMSPKTPLNILRDLARQGGDDVRAKVARNPVTPRSLLEELLGNDSYEVWTAAFKVLANQPDAPDELLRERLRKTDPVEKRALSKEKSLPDWVYKAL